MVIKMKGISGFVGIALIIAITLAVAAIYSGWFTSFVRTIINEIKGQSEEKILCSNGGIALDDLKYNQSSGIISGSIKNTDIISLGDIDIEIFLTNATRIFLNLNKTLDPGEKDSFSYNLSTSAYDSIRVKTNCSNVDDEISSNYVSIVI
jgi:FlaG/FlaF family flagellin (archaellin)